MTLLKTILGFFIAEIRTAVNSIRASYKAAPQELQKGVRRLLAVSAVVVLALIAWSYGRDYFEHKRMAEEIARGPRVKTAIAKPAATERKVQVLGEAKPFAAVTLYAKVSGYLKDVKVDKGDVVKKGQWLATIESPETDKAYQAAFSDAKNKNSIAKRIEKLLARDLVSAQEAETARSDAEVASARLESQEVLKSYETLRAPFDGTITARYADPGALVQNAANSQTSALPILAVSDVKKLRIYVYLDQRDALSVAKGTPARVSLSERPDLMLIGEVARVTGELDEKTRMLLAEVDVDNKGGQIVAGSLVQVSLDLKSAPGILVPSEALVLRQGKTVVPVIDDKNEVTYTDVKVIDNDGNNVKIQSGLAAGQVVALSLGNTVNDHGKVRPVRDAAPLPVQSPAQSPTQPTAQSSTTVGTAGGEPAK